MNAVAGTVRKVAGAATRAATMTTEAAGAIGGAALNGVIGGLKGAASGAQRGLSTGSHSTPAAALTLGALGVSGLVEWPVLVAVGGTALVLKQLNGRSEDGKAPTAAPAKTPAKAPTAAARPLKSVKSGKPAGSPRRSPQPKKTTARQSRSGSSARARH
ncbi:hypothetical protein EHH44_15605 [Mycolicibacter terrae]|uniref:Transmembrane protein n=2 Tax=Mycolicibacter TaxID=1073531 RepID=A0A1A2XLC4_MYCSD|nr:MULTISPECIES: hypothetical protein [Mycolicibacter]OBH21657.1 hypothetical protein A5694_12575 [Mycolicibacter sinensis]OBI26564.1 hypothetical protein A5710_06690 [Mycolicibacter sinensis]RRR42960.1 hypothetical protein EHH44_15605 [Mycolicibacter terrae]